MFRLRSELRPHHHHPYGVLTGQHPIGDPPQHLYGTPLVQPLLETTPPPPLWGSNSALQSEPPPQPCGAPPVQPQSPHGVPARCGSIDAIRTADPPPIGPIEPGPPPLRGSLGANPNLRPPPGSRQCSPIALWGLSAPRAALAAFHPQSPSAHASLPPPLLLHAPSGHFARPRPPR